jgi:hypothetical protein
MEHDRPDRVLAVSNDHRFLVLLRNILAESGPAPIHTGCAGLSCAAGTWAAELSSIPAPTQTALRTLEWIGRHENLVVCGPSVQANVS